jgi:hypothetical protein
MDLYTICALEVVWSALRGVVCVIDDGVSASPCFGLRAGARGASGFRGFAGLGARALGFCGLRLGCDVQRFACQGSLGSWGFALMAMAFNLRV